MAVTGTIRGVRDQPPSTSLPGALVTLRFLVRPVAVMQRLQRELGDTFKFEIGGVQATVMGRGRATSA